MHADVARMERVAMNIANAQTPGYKREVAAHATFASHVDGAREAVVHQSDMRPGMLRATGQPLDLAIMGDAWFEVDTPEGTAYTRQGNFRLDAQGRLVTQHGAPVMGTTGEIRLQHGAPVIDASGRIFEGAGAAGARYPLSTTPVGQLRLWTFDRAAVSTRLGNGLMAMPAERMAAHEGANQVLQGHLEASNVNPMQEMVRLLETLRHMETMQKVALGYDEMLATSVRRLGEP
jgi:flagellar basal-body rod protein FlgG